LCEIKDWIEHHLGYREIQRLGFLEFGLQAMNHRGGLLGWPEPVPPVAKSLFTYSFHPGRIWDHVPDQCLGHRRLSGVSARREALKVKILPGMLSQDADTLLRGTQFMTEKQAGSDVGLVSD
jgi:hypothetical protein